MKNLVSFGLLTLSALAAQEAMAQTMVSSAVSMPVQYNMSTADLIRNATAAEVPVLPFPFATDRRQKVARASKEPKDKPAQIAGVGPRISASGRSETGAAAVEISPQTQPGTRAVGSLISPFTSSRATIKQIRAFYPYSTIGKLFFVSAKTGKAQYCTAAVIKKALILTAPTCLHTGTGDNAGWSSNLVFVPAFSSQGGQYTAPLGVFKAKNMLVHRSRFSNPNNAQDGFAWGLVEMEVQPNGDSVGSLTGMLGVGFNMIDAYLNFGTTTKLGYTPTRDAGGEMQRVDTLATGYVGVDKLLYGTDLESGSLGAPMIANFGIEPEYTPYNGVPKPEPKYAERNIIVGIHQYQAYDANGKFAFTGFLSPFKDAFKEVLEAVCAASPKTCN